MQMRLTEKVTCGVVEAAAAAPSIHNTRPWQFEGLDDELRLHGLSYRAPATADPDARALCISCGAALFNARLALRVAGLDTSVSLLPHPDYPLDVLAVMRTTGALAPTAGEDNLYGSIWKRHTNRHSFSRKRIPPILLAGLQKSAEAEQVRLRPLNRPDLQLIALTTDYDEPRDWLRAGQALQHVLLVAILNGLSASFVYQPISRDDLREDGERDWPWPEHAQMIVRLGDESGPDRTADRSVLPGVACLAPSG